MSFSTRHLVVASALASTTALGAGCDLIDALDNEGSTLVQLMVTHHATPEDGAFPDRTNGDARTFETDDGWEVSLRTAYVTTSHATLHACEGGSVDFDAFWGQLPEDITTTDLELLSFAAVEVEAGRFCGMTVEYGPFVASDDNRRKHEMGEHGDKIENATYYFEGIASKDGASVDFEFSGARATSVELDLSYVMNGGPLAISAEEPFPVDLTLSKTYDRFFDGVDFESFDERDVDANIMAVLELESRVALGTRVIAE